MWLCVCVRVVHVCVSQIQNGATKDDKLGAALVVRNIGEQRIRKGLARTSRRSNNGNKATGQRVDNQRQARVHEHVTQQQCAEQQVSLSSVRRDCRSVLALGRRACDDEMCGWSRVSGMGNNSWAGAQKSRYECGIVLGQ